MMVAYSSTDHYARNWQDDPHHDQQGWRSLGNPSAGARTPPIRLRLLLRHAQHHRHRHAGASYRVWYAFRHRQSLCSSYVVNANTGGWTALPDAAAGASGGLVGIGTGANNFRSDSGASVYVSSGTGANHSVLKWRRSSQWQLVHGHATMALRLPLRCGKTTSSGDFSTSSSIGALLRADVNSPIGSIPTNPYTGTPPTATSIAQAVLTDTTVPRRRTASAS